MPVCTGVKRKEWLIRMEFHEKLQELRKKRGLTQEELAESLYVSRTAVSKWESGRGYPSIDSLKEISKFFSVSIDDLLSGEMLIDIAEKENQSNMQSMCKRLFGVVDLCSFLLIALPLYPNELDGKIFSVNLFQYTESLPVIRVSYWVLYLSLFLLGLINFMSEKIKPERNCRIIKSDILVELSLGLNILLVLILAITRVAYATVMAFLLLVVKGMGMLEGRINNLLSLK